MAASESTAPAPHGEGLLGIIGLLAAIVLGVLLGALYGQPMWIAGGGPQRAVTKLQATLEQQSRFADEAQTTDPARAEQLRGHRPKIEARIAEVQAIAQQPKTMLAKVLWELTKFCGDVFLQSLKLLVIPLVVTSMICGITSLGDVRRLGRLGASTILFFVSSMAVAATIGLALVTWIAPGVGADDTFAYTDERITAGGDISAIETLLAVVRGQPGDPSSGMIPSNLFLAASNTNVLALIFFALVFGGTLTTLGKRGQVVIDFFVAVNETIMRMVHLVMWFAPIGIFGLVAHEIAKQGGGAEFLVQLSAVGKYVLTVVLGLGLQMLFLTLLLPLLAGRSAWDYLVGNSRALLTALTTSSSSATLPVSLECVEVNNGVSGRTAGFVLPLGATVNMDGTALYEAVAVVFVAQSLGVELSLGQLVVVFLTSTLAAIGAAGIPSAGLVTMVMVLTAVGLPVSGIGLILAIDWLLDRLRTTVNVYGDMVAAAVIDRRVPLDT